MFEFELILEKVLKGVGLMSTSVIPATQEKESRRIEVQGLP
jgi:hypothetical protein